MTIRNLDRLFAPRSVAVIGASDRPGNLGGIVMANLRAGGFGGPLWAVHPRGGTLAGERVLPDVAALPAAPDLAVICTPASTVPQLVAELGRKGTRAAVVITAGLKQRPREGGPTLEQQMLEAARPFLLRILGPNCIGELVPGIGLNASFAPGAAAPGNIAFVTQSGALATAMLDWAGSRGIGFSHFVSLGDSADVDFGDVLDYLGSDVGTRSILMYVESVKHARKFMSAARAAARNKPVIVVKAGRAEEGARAAASHTGALAGSDEVFAAAIRRAGMVRVDTLQALFDAAETLARPLRWQGERLALLTNGGGAGVLAADALSLGGGRLAELSDATLRALDAILPGNWPRGNPVDIIGDAPVERYREALRILLAAPEIDGVLFMHAPTAIVAARDIAQACLEVARKATKPVLSCWLGGRTVEAAREAFSTGGLATYATPEHAAAAWLHLTQYHRNQQTLLELPDARPVELRADASAAQAVLRQAAAAGREWLDEDQARAVLRAYGLPTVATEQVEDSEDAAAAAADRLGYPVALKIRSPQIVHKTDVGGVALGLASAQDVRTAVQRMRASVARHVPGAQVLGFTVQAMAARPQAHEVIVGIASDEVFGPVVLFGAGGTAVEILRDRAMELPPLNAQLARALVARTRVSALLRGYRGRPPVDEAALLDAILRVSQMASDLDALAELDINPLLADSQGVLALDARIRLRPATGKPGARLALRPYPADLARSVQVDGRTLRVRPIRPEDGRALNDFYAAARPGDMRLRFFHSVREVPRSELARYCQIDYEREMTFVAMEGERMAGDVRAICDPDGVEAEFAIQVAADWQRRGLGSLLLQRMLDYLRDRGVRQVTGQCLQENAGMAALARSAGFDVRAGAEGVLALRLQLAASP